MHPKDFYKAGATERQDQIIRISEKNYLLIYGYEEDADGLTYNYRKNYDHRPTLEELRTDTAALINRRTESDILTGFTWQGKPVWLSQENQHNFKAAYDLAHQTNGATLPVSFKLGEDSDGSPLYHTFTTLEEFTDFITQATAHVHQCLKRGWEEKDGVSWSAFTI